jgi:cell volume regulation protein A
LFWKYTVKEKILLCWGGIKGVIPIVLATYPVAAGLEGGRYYFNIVFFVVLISALVQGSTIEVAAKKLGLLTGNKRLSSHSLELISLEHSGCELLEYDVGAGSSLLNRQLKEIPLPENALVTAIVRQNDLFAPRGETIIEDKDLLYILVRDEDKEELLGVLEPPAEEPAAGAEELAREEAEIELSGVLEPPGAEPAADAAAGVETEDAREEKPESIP